jgi:hypothetical protein
MPGNCSPLMDSSSRTVLIEYCSVCVLSTTTANASVLAGQALEYFAALYDVEREAAGLDPEHRRDLRQERARPIADALHDWMTGQRGLVSEGSAIAKAFSVYRTSACQCRNA